MFDAVDFSNNANFTSKHALHFLQHCEHHFKWKESEEILEIGCADGRITRHILHPFVEKYLKHLEATDIDKEAINAAKLGNDKRNIQFSVMDVNNQELINANKNKYDHVFAFYLLHLVPVDFWPKTLFTMTKPGGQIFASIYLAPNIYTKTIQSQMAEENKSWSKYFKNYSDIFHSYYGSNPIKTVTDLLTNAGFVVDFVDELVVPGIYDSKEALHKTLMSVNSFARTLPTDILSEYRNNFGEKMMEHAEKCTGEEQCTNMETIVFVASKPVH